MKIATHVLLFGADKWIMRNIENAYPHVDKIYVSYSYVPWTYNPNARSQYKNTFDIQTILTSKFIDKIVLVCANWDTEEEQRNECVDLAIKDGMDYLIIHDADEFYFHDQFRNAIEEIKNNPDHDYYEIAWYCFWKSFKNLLLNSDGNEITGYPQFAINLKRGVRFQRKRCPTKLDYYRIPSSVAICFHGSYVLTNEELLQKINTWGHTNEFDKHHWFNQIWLRWNREMTNLHLVSPSAWQRAVEFNRDLPEVIKDLQ